MIKKKTGYINVLGGKVWYEIVGKKGKIPLITVHGGPGYPHDYLEPLEDLSDEREVIFYDQLGCGKSDRPDDISLWIVDRFVKELQEIIKSLSLKEYHILGQSWGAALALAFALTKPKGLKSLVLSDPYISSPRWEKDAKRLMKSLPENMRKAIKEGENNPEFKVASKEFNKRFVRRINNEAFTKSGEGFGKVVYRYMWGPEECKLKGTLKRFDLSGKLYEIDIPVLLICGRNDEATPESTEYFKNLFPNAQMKIFEKSEHMPFWNERKTYMKTVRDFLKL